MTGFEIQRLSFDDASVASMPALHERFEDWPVVYTLDDGRSVYVGESQSAANRMRQHRANPDKRPLRALRVIVDETFNKSVCLDLESTLIRWFQGDERLAVLNRNDGITNADYYRREEYRETFEDIFASLKAEGLFQRTIPQIENSDLFKLSPFKALNRDQAVAVEAIMDGLVEDLRAGPRHRSLSIVQGDPGTGKTIVGIYLMKLLADIAVRRDLEDSDPDSLFSDYFLVGTQELFVGLRVGLVVPQQSLRKSIEKVFARTPGLDRVQVLSPFDVGGDPGEWDVLIVDEAHRLNQLAAQAHGTLTKRFKEITASLFGTLDPAITQLDWIRAKSRHVILLLDTAQSVRPADIGPAAFAGVIAAARADGRHYPLVSQMRVAGGDDYIAFVRALLSDEPPAQAPDFGGDYELRLVDSAAEMIAQIAAKDAEHGLSRVLAGYAWDWKSRKDPAAYDIELGEARLRWNSKAVDWISSPASVHEAGSIHTVQGYDLNYAGVIIGPDLRIDPSSGKLVVSRADYRDRAGKSGIKMRGIPTTDEDLLRYIRNIYAVLMTRGMRGTLVHVVDPGLRERFARALGAAG